MSAEGVIEKIKKAIRLAQKAGTEGERVAAENAAKRLADAHGINLGELKVGDSDIKAIMKEGDKKYRRHGAEVGFACNIINKHFGVVIMQYVRSHDNWARFVFFGVNINIEISKYVYDILMREFHKDWREVHGWGLNKRSFMSGWFMMIDKKLTEHPIRNDREQFEAEREAAREKFKQFKSEVGGVKETETKVNKADSEALYRGFECARRVNLSRPCEGTASSSPFALGHTRQLEAVS